MRFLLFSLIGILLSQPTYAQTELNVITFNIRYNNAGDSLNAWPYRKDKVASQILFHQADIVGIQEALNNQIQDLVKHLPNYKYAGGRRDDGKTKGEYSAIFYNTKRLEALQSATFWLSEKPSIVGSKGWDANLPRIVTWIKFKDKITGKTFFHFNTHFDHIGKIARRESAKYLIRAVDSIAGKTEAIITGDFNATPTDEPIQVITDANNPQHLLDTKPLSITPHYGPTGTFNGFGTKERDDSPIDYIFISQNIKILQHATLSQTWQGRFSSDHFPVFAKILLYVIKSLSLLLLIEKCLYKRLLLYHMR